MEEENYQICDKCGKKPAVICYQLCWIAYDYDAKTDTYDNERILDYVEPVETQHRCEDCKD